MHPQGVKESNKHTDSGCELHSRETKLNPQAPRKSLYRAPRGWLFIRKVPEEKANPGNTAREKHFGVSRDQGQTLPRTAQRETETEGTPHVAARWERGIRTK